MSEWKIIPSYKMDLACACNLFLLEENVNKIHRETYEHFKSTIEKRQDFIILSKRLMQGGIIIGCTIETVLELISYNGCDIDEICRLFEDESMRFILKNYALSQNIDEKTYNENFLPVIPVFGEILRYLHSNGFLEYWQEYCLPEIEEKAKQFESLSEQYPVIGKVNELLGYEKVKSHFVNLYLCKMSAPYGVGLKDGFISDIRWSFEDTVDVAIHEFIHPPFSREKIAEMAEVIYTDEFFIEAKSRLPESSGYKKPGDFLEENLVEGTHVYLSSLLGIQKDPLKYFIEHDYGSHVISVVLYDALKRGYRKKVNNIQEVVERLIKDKTLKPGNIRHNYEKIYKKAKMKNLLLYK